MRAKENAPARRGNAVRGDTKGWRNANVDSLPQGADIVLGAVVLVGFAAVICRALGVF